MERLFGTDGIRGVVNAGLDGELAYQVGLAAAKVLAQGKQEGERPLVTMGKDTRVSGDLLKGALIAGLCTAGADVMDLGTLPTPGVAWMTVNQGADAGIVISASHNPFEYNGIKLFNGQGYKLSDELEEQMEEMIRSRPQGLPRKTHAQIGRVLYCADRAVSDYVGYLASTVQSDLSGLRILVDCGNGAAYTTAHLLFEQFPKLQSDVIHAAPNGLNINDGCGSTHMDSLSAMVKAGGYDLGLAFDGDADRCLGVDEQGNLIDGDQIMAAWGCALRDQGLLKDQVVVATVMSNLGLHLFAKEEGLRLLCTDVGDRNVLECMQRDGYTLGGEQSGHMIFRQYATTGDGQLTALQMLDLLCRSGQKASELFGRCVRYPQILKNIPVADQGAKARTMEAPELWKMVEDEEELLGGEGRILVRPSGTEALIRVMVEAKTQENAEKIAEKIAKFIQTLLA